MSSNQHHGDNPKLEAARLRLQNATNQVDTFEAIREIIANLLGSEEMALYRIDQERAVLWLMWSFGIDPHTHSMIDLLNEPTLNLIFKGESFIGDANARIKLNALKEPVSAFIPIRFKGHTVAVLAIMKLLAQKQTIEVEDTELFQMLSIEIGHALSAERTASFLTKLLEEEL